MLWLFLIYLAWNSLVFQLFKLDKQRAKKKKRRIKERHLLTCLLLGGSLGGYIAMRVYRHKTKKWYFYVAVLIGLCLLGLLLFYTDRITFLNG